MSDLDRLSALLVQQAELSAQREERLAGMLERLMNRQPSALPDTPGVADGQASAAAGQGSAAAAAARPPMRMPASATPAPHLTSSVSLRDFTVWKEKFHGYMMLTGAATLPVESQRAVLLSLLDERLAPGHPVRSRRGRERGPWKPLWVPWRDICVSSGMFWWTAGTFTRAHRNPVSVSMTFYAR